VDKTKHDHHLLIVERVCQACNQVPIEREHSRSQEVGGPFAPLPRYARVAVSVRNQHRYIGADRGALLVTRELVSRTRRLVFELSAYLEQLRCRWQEGAQHHDGTERNRAEVQSGVDGHRSTCNSESVSQSIDTESKRPKTWRTLTEPDERDAVRRYTGRNLTVDHLLHCNTCARHTDTISLRLSNKKIEIKAG